MYQEEACFSSFSLGSSPLIPMDQSEITTADPAKQIIPKVALQLSTAV